MARQQGKKDQERLLSDAQKSAPPLLSPLFGRQRGSGMGRGWMVGKALPNPISSRPLHPQPTEVPAFDLHFTLCSANHGFSLSLAPAGDDPCSTVARIDGLTCDL